MADSLSFYELRNLVLADKAAARRRFAADPNLRHIRNSLDETLLHWFAVENFQAEVAWLFERGASLNTRNMDESTPLLDVVKLGYTDLALFLLEKGADPRPINDKDETALSVAQERGDTRLIPFLEAALLEWADSPEPSTASTLSAAEERRRLDIWLRKNNSRKAR